MELTRLQRQALNAVQEDEPITAAEMSMHWPNLGKQAYTSILLRNLASLGYIENVSVSNPPAYRLTEKGRCEMFGRSENDLTTASLRSAASATDDQ